MFLQSTALRGCAPKATRFTGVPKPVALPVSRSLVIVDASQRLYVGNLSWSTTKDDLLQLFSKYGEIEDAFVATDRDTGRSRGFGFVTLDSGIAADAISGEDGQEFMGRALRVNEAVEREAGGERPQGDRPYGGRGRGGYRGGRGGGGRGGGRGYREYSDAPGGSYGGRGQRRSYGEGDE